MQKKHYLFLPLEAIPYACVKSIGCFDQYNLSELDCDTLFSNPDDNEEILEIKLHEKQ